MNNYKIIYTKPMYEFLAINDVLPVKIIPNYKAPTFVCWVYANTVKLQETMRKYKK